MTFRMRIIAYIGDMQRGHERVVLLHLDRYLWQHDAAFACESFLHNECKVKKKIHLIQKIFHLFIREYVLPLQREN
jgi:hypothetical protein